MWHFVSAAVRAMMRHFVSAAVRAVMWHFVSAAVRTGMGRRGRKFPRITFAAEGGQRRRGGFFFVAQLFVELFYGSEHCGNFLLRKAGKERLSELAALVIRELDCFASALCDGDQ